MTRALFIASIGNGHPYRFTRHSAGHVLLDALRPLLLTRAPFTDRTAFYETWYSPSYMNESGPKLVRQLDRFLSKQAAAARGSSSSATPVQSTLVILHDELEAAPGKLRVRRGGPEQFSLRGHRGLISVMESLRGKKLYPPASSNTTVASGAGSLSILRVGIGIGRPDTRGKNDVAEYVLTPMSQTELDAVKKVAGETADVLAKEFDVVL
ncbi:hypothetical protein ASPZODRAFT_129115 [Penicilliopsis zonata CBS 506.65]|uniref:Peptidyl-tRNA hydrolase n=1 Tax=Penicilliopsis zonata CBS 506.65 TaxID=1073090 RepID=A0A1L9SP28_9EURO|nr:hypothetical protein ASPZODRAFT_129115 [Penicilliopsis zonata CBS 506.65]OJJ48804.1 hypothetical protein ASPZODRAFT_129115 [Penicilliopsis zonata CBS 506.65]